MRHVASAFLLSVLALSLLGTAAPAAAEPTEAQLGAIKSNCRSDFMSNCWGVKRGGFEAMQCLKEHMAKLSPGCQTAVKAATPPPAPAPVKTPSAPAEPAPAPAVTAAPVPETPPEAPAPSAAEAPPAAPAAETKAATPQAAPTSPPKAAAAPAVPPSAVKTEAPVTPPPAAAAAEPEAEPAIIGFIPPRKKLMVLRDCRQDLETYCADVERGEGRNLRCLFSHKASLTPGCQDTLAKLAQ